MAILAVRCKWIPHGRVVEPVVNRLEDMRQSTNPPTRTAPQPAASGRDQSRNCRVQPQRSWRLMKERVVASGVEHTCRISVPAAQVLVGSELGPKEASSLICQCDSELLQREFL